MSFEATRKAFSLPATHVRAYVRLLFHSSSYIYSTGWFRSLEERRPVNKNGDPLPWMNYPVISFLEERLNGHLNLFEYGSGYSTLFFARRVKHVTSVEHDRKWFDEVKRKMPDNVELMLKELDIDGNYCSSVLSGPAPYDVIVVDGADRLNCLKYAVKALTPEGVIVLDDTGPSSKENQIAYLVHNGFRALNFEGLKPTLSGIDRTTIFYKRNNCLDI